MTAPSLLDELEEVVRLIEKATSGPWSHQESTSDTCGFEVVQKRLNGDVVAGEYGIHEYDDARLIAAAVNFIRTHHAEIAAMAKRLEAAERKVSRLTAMRNEWERDAREHLNTFGQHLPASVECLVERFDAATQEGEG